jgi:hypothetical protein
MPRGGKRPGAGAPKGNLNAYRHGKNSQQYQRLLQALADDPEALRILQQLAVPDQKQALRRRYYAMQVLKRVLDRHEQETTDRVYEAMLRDRDSHMPRLYPDRLD